MNFDMKIKILLHNGLVKCREVKLFFYKKVLPLLAQGSKI